MFNKIKKSFTIALAVVLAFATVAACATGNLQWNAKKVGVDVDFYNANRGGIIPIQYQIFNQNGVMVEYVETPAEAVEYGLKPYAVAELKNPWVSVDYPNNEYADLYADGEKVLNVAYATGRDGELAGVDYRYVDFMWEAAVPHRIYSQKQAYLFVNGVAQWYANATYPVIYSGRNAQVKAERIYYGFGDYKVTGNDAIELMPAYMAPWVGDEVFTAIEGLTAANLAPNAAAVDATDFWKDIKIPQSYDIKLVGPGFDANGNQIPDAKTIIGSDIKTVNPANLAIDDVIGITRDTFGAIHYAELDWKASNFIQVYPYNTVVFLEVDGVLMDGRMEAPGYTRPKIFRYIGGHAGDNAHGGIVELPNASNVEIAMENGVAK
jgi:hypothetical protein